MNSIISYY